MPFLVSVTNADRNGITKFGDKSRRKGSLVRSYASLTEQLRERPPRRPRIARSLHK